MKTAIGIITAIIGLAILATVLSNRSNTSQLISSATGGFSGLLKTALSPIR